MNLKQLRSMRKTIHLFEKWDKAGQTNMRSEKLCEDSGPREAPPRPWNGLLEDLVSLCGGWPSLTTPWKFHMEKGLEPECSGWKGTEWPRVSLQPIGNAIFENTCPCVCPPYFSNHTRMHYIASGVCQRRETDHDQEPVETPELHVGTNIPMST